MTSLLGSRAGLTTNDGGIGAFALAGLANVPVGTLVAARVNGGDLSNCVVADRNNVAWPTAFQLTAPATDNANFLRSSGQARWFKIPVLANSRLTVTLKNAPADYDLVVFKDIQKKYAELTAGIPPRARTSRSPISTARAPRRPSTSSTRPSTTRPHGIRRTGSRI